MIPQSQPKKRKNNSKTDLIISVVFHGVLIGTAFYFAAREGLLGKQVQKIAVEMVKEKKPEPPKPKPEPPKVEPPKIEIPKEAPKYVEPKAAPPSSAPPAVAPPAADVPSFEFEGGKTVNSERDPVLLYRGYMEYNLRTKWNRPEDMDDAKYVAEVAVDVDKQGNISHPTWLKSSGNAKWDQTVKDVFKVVQNIDRRPPTNFPPTVTIRFDIQEEAEPVLMQ